MGTSKTQIEQVRETERTNPTAALEQPSPEGQLARDRIRRTAAKARSTMSLPLVPGDQGAGPAAISTITSAPGQSPVSLRRRLEGLHAHGRLDPVQSEIPVGEPGDPYEREADEVANRLVSSQRIHRISRIGGYGSAPAPDLRETDAAGPRTPPAASGGAASERRLWRVSAAVQTAASRGFVPGGASGGPGAVTDASTQQRINSPGSGRPLPAGIRREMEAGLGSDLSGVRIHDTQADRSVAASLNAKAFAYGDGVWLGNEASVADRRLMAHELTHVVQQGATIRRNGDGAPISRLRQLLQDDEEEAAIALMGQIGPSGSAAVLESRELKALAIRAFDDREMYRAMLLLGGNLYRRLDWMFEEGTSWDMTLVIIAGQVEGRDRVRSDAGMRRRFVAICNDAEMADVVDLLGGTLLQRLQWMAAEGSSWDLVSSKLTAIGVDPGEKTDLYSHTDMRDFFVDVCTNRTMAEAVDLLGGTLLQKLQWMAAEGSNWDLVSSKLTAKGVDPGEKTDLYSHTDMRDFFVDVCTNRTMAEAVDLLGGTLLQKLQWMAAEGSSWDLVRPKLTAGVPAGEKTALYAHSDMRDFFVDVCDDTTIVIATRILGGTWAQRLAWMRAEGVTEPVAAEMEDMLGEQATWVQSGPTSTNAFATWARAPTEAAAPSINRSTTINCWEMVLLAAYRSQVIDWNWIHNLYVSTPYPNWPSRLAASRSAYVPGTSVLSRGDIVFFNNLAHVALATGERDDVYTFWPPPDNPSYNGTVDRIKIRTIRAISAYMAGVPTWGGAPTVTFGAPSW
jgi:hypothetical protein